MPGCANQHVNLWRAKGSCKLEYYYLFEENSVRTAHLLCNALGLLTIPQIYSQISGQDKKSVLSLFPNNWIHTR